MQFGSTLEIGYTDGSFLVKTLLQMRKETDKSAWVVFVDLINAFDSINHELRFNLLEKFGIPDRAIMVRLTAGKCIYFVDYSIRVKQGGNLVPILFILIMHFLAEL